MFGMLLCGAKENNVHIVRTSRILQGERERNKKKVYIFPFRVEWFSSVPGTLVSVDTLVVK